MPGLFDPIEVRGLRLKNRLVMAPMATNMATLEGEVTDRHIKHYSARANGGVGLIVLEHTYVLRNGRAQSVQLGLWDDKLVPGLKRLVDAIHSDGAKVCIQLTHAGCRTTSEVIGEQPVGPSTIALPRGETPRPLSVDEIQSIVAAFAQAARRAVEAGCDAVEVHGAHGYLVGQFISPYTNHRDDAYGAAGRLKFPMEVVAATRAVLGQAVPIFYRLGVDDGVDGGFTPANARSAATQLEKAGVDVIDISGGISGPMRGSPDEQGFFVPLAHTIKEAVTIPVIGVGNITEPEFADRVIREGQVDLVALGRKLLSDPAFPGEAAKKLGLA